MVCVKYLKKGFFLFFTFILDFNGSIFGARVWRITVATFTRMGTMYGVRILWWRTWRFMIVVSARCWMATTVTVATRWFPWWACCCRWITRFHYKFYMFFLSYSRLEIVWFFVYGLFLMKFLIWIVYVTIIFLAIILVHELLSWCWMDGWLI